MKNTHRSGEHPGNPHKIEDHDGVVAIRPIPEKPAVEIAFDPSKLTEREVRQIVTRHLQPVNLGNNRLALRLDGDACEAAAAKLEKRIEKVPGVRKATATYIGKVLCLTFDSGVSDHSAVLEGVKAAGAKVAELKPAEATGGLWSRIRSGDLNEEISCAVGTLFLIASAIADFSIGKSALTNFLYLGAYIFSGQYGVRSAVASLRERTLDIDVLMVLAAIGAALVGSPFEGALLLFLFSFSNVLQRHALDRTRRAIESLLTLRPEKALRKKNGVTEMTAIEDLEVGDIVIVRPGEHVSVDGTVTEGSSHVNESSLTGESMPVSKGVGDGVFAGTLNQSGALEVTVGKKAEDSTLARMVKLVAEAQAEKSKTQRFLEKAEQGYAAAVIGFTVLVLCIPWLLWGEDFTTAFYRAMTVMVVASPCALVISTPATVLSAIGGAARRGILIKGGSHLETSARIDIICFDKTGTLTVGKPSVTDLLTESTHDHPGKAPLSEVAGNLLKACGALESKSEHPLATAIVGAAKLAGLTLPEATGFQATPGKGAEAEVDGLRYVVGSERFFNEIEAQSRDAFSSRAAALQADGKTCVWMGLRDGSAVTTLAVFGLADTLRPEAKSISERLHKLGIKKVIMLTGDQSTVAASIAREAGVDEFRAELLPADKVQAIRELKKEGTVMMIGDGVNDAPALATANLGVAMGAAGTDVAMETADVVLMGDRLDNIPLLVGMSRHAKRVLTQNLVFASCVIVILVAAALGFDLPLPIGVVGHEGSTVLVCLNGLRLLIYREK